MLRELSSASILILMLFGSVASAVSAAPPTIQRPMEIIKAAIEGGVPETVDPAWSYYSASAELIMQVYDTLVVFDGERVGSCLPALATSWAEENIAGETSPEGLSWYFRYTFEIRAGVHWHDPAYGTVSPTDVEYSFERAMVQDRDGGPQWMLYEPLLNSWGAEGLGYNLSIPAEAAVVGGMIDHAVESNATHVWFNLAFPSVYPPFMQILSEVWGSVLCKAWVVNHVIGALGRPDWDGVWGDYTGWVMYHSPLISPLDEATPSMTAVMMGCGPFEYGSLDYTLEQWDVWRFVDYWRGWPIDWPAMAGAQPAGYVDHFVVTWAFSWPVRKALFLAGDVDYCAVPSENFGEILGQDGIRCVYPLPTLHCDAMFFTFDIDPAMTRGQILAPGTFNEVGIPSDFFGNASWGIHVRKAFAHAFDYDAFLATAYQGEATHPATAVIPGLPYHDSSILGFTYNLTQAQAEFEAVPGLWSTGFSLTLEYQELDSYIEAAFLTLKTGIESLNSKFHITLYPNGWRPFVYWIAAASHCLPIFIFGWLPDYPDPHILSQQFYCGYSHPRNYRSTFWGTFYFGYYPVWQCYNNTVMNSLIDEGRTASEGSARAAIYRDIQILAVQDCPSFTLSQPFERHFERDWMQGWYYNPSHHGYYLRHVRLYAANLWKWYYVEEASQSTAVQPYSSRLPVDVNYDGKVGMKDVGTAARAFGTLYGPSIHSEWNFRADINCDRKIDMDDIGLIVKNFGKTSPVWKPPP